MSNNTNSSCGAFLFTSISVESNPEQLGNICPDTIINYLVAAIILTLALFFFTSSLIMLIIYGWKNRQMKQSKIQTERLAYVRARNPIIMLVNLFTSAGIATFHTLRYLIGRKIFPCGLLSLSYFLIPPVIFLPTLLRSSRAFNMARINSLITSTRRRKTLSIDSNGKSIIFEQAMPNIASNPTTIDEELADSNTNSPNKQSEQQPQPTTPRKVEFKFDINEQQQQQQPTTENTFSDTESDVGSLYDIETSISKSIINQLKILNILISNKFIFILYFAVLSCHVLLWLVLGGIEEGIYQSNPSQSRIFAGFLHFTSGCVVNINGVVVVICQAVLYLIAEIILLILHFISERDTYYIKLETFIVVGMQVGVTLIFGLSYIGAINRYTEYFYAGGNIIASFAVLELLVSNFLPLVLSYYNDSRIVSSRKSTAAASETIRRMTMDDTQPQQTSPIAADDEENQIGGISDNKAEDRGSLYGILDAASTSAILILLRHKKYSEQFLLYAQRSYCPENILCWRDIEAYKKVKKDASRRRIGQFILGTYLIHHSPLELNISKEDKRVQEIEQVLTNKSLPLRADLFDFLQLHCLLNMLDIFERLKSSNKEIREYLKGSKAATPSTGNLN